MKRTIALLCLLPALAAAAETDSWFQPAPETLRDTRPSESIPAVKFFEVAASKVTTAEFWLADKPVMPLGQESPGYFGQHNFSCPAPARPYLVRALYRNGETGTFYLTRYDAALLVLHRSFGMPSSMQRTALVICLDFEPTDVYHSLSTAM